ncbi:MAG: hypothetical protein RIS35_1566 [Pseudomonadota bacterium]|jgi:primosomal protein N' (replication factor Y)
MDVGPIPGFLRVALDVPGVEGFDYALPEGLTAAVRPGAWVVVPWGKARRVGIVIERLASTEVPPERLKTVIEVIPDAPVLDPHWLTLVRFAARYYHRGVGEVALPAIPKLLRTPPTARSRGSVFARARGRGPKAGDAQPGPVVELNEAQQQALDRLCSDDGFSVNLLHGITGSGKTEVYLRWLAAVLARRPQAQVLLLVPEIALTPQLFGQIAGRFAGEPVAVLHSDLPDGERAAQWLAVAEGCVRLVVGTRLSVLTPLPGLAAIVVDEEHDASYKQQEGVRYSARDLAIALASQRGIPVVLGSATPSLESWLAVKRHRYRLLALPGRAGEGALPRLRVLDPRGRQLRHSLMPESLEAIGRTLERGEQVLVFINRRGYAPVLGCEACGWLSRCTGCSAYRVLHRLDGPALVRPRAASASPTATGAASAATDDARAGRSRYRLVCHHCGQDCAVPRACPDCGNVDLSAVGRGTQRLEEGLRELFPQARIARVDRDVARRRNAARDVIEAAHAGEVDILVGTQMLAKGHDFRGLTLVVVVDADGGLYSSDFRAPERLFAVLMQVAGRAGRSGARSEVIVQTRFPGHPIFAALARHDYALFADAQLAERQQAQLPPFLFQALLRAQSGTLDAALGFLTRARALAQPSDEVVVFDPVPMPMMRLAGQERAQLLVESASRRALHAFVEDWLARLGAIRPQVQWQLEIDPLEI